MKNYSSAAKFTPQETVVNPLMSNRG